MPPRVRRGIREEHRFVVQVSDHQILPTVPVPVQPGGRPPQPGSLKIGTDVRAGKFLEPLPIPVKELRPHPIRPAQTRQIVDVAVGHEQFQPSVEIHIDKLRAKSQKPQRRFAEPQRPRPILKDAGRGNQKQRIRLRQKVRDVQIEPSVAVDVIGRNSHGAIASPS